ncbi:MAG: dihydroorotase [Acidimicrobiales bacterium]|jgi:dihydroorotase
MTAQNPSIHFGPSAHPGEVLVRGGTLVDETGERRGDVLARDGRVVAVSNGDSIEPPSGAMVLDAGGCIVSPGLVDIHSHLREPGGEIAETVESGSRAGALGGYTALVAMPNTVPAIDSAAVARDVLALGEQALCEIAVAGAITLGRRGERLVPMAELAELGVRLFTDDGKGVQNGGLMRRALEYASGLGVVLAQHCEDEQLAAGGQMHEGAWSSRLGIAGQPALAEEAMLARDLALVALTGAPMHFLHLSTAGSIEMIAKAKADGLAVTAEATPHHLALCDAAVQSYDPVYKVNPPLRTPADVAAVRAGLAGGVIDAIATDHAPHAPERKEEPFDEAPAGMLGLETALAVAYDALCARTGQGEGAGAGVGWVPPAGGTAMPLRDLFALFSWKPARIAGLERDGDNGRGRGGGQGGPIRPGAMAHLTVFDPSAEWVVDPARQASRSRNTPYAGRRLTGKVRHTVFAGEPVVVDGEAQR